MKKHLLILLIAFGYFQLNAQNWNEVKKAVASDRDTLAWFGYSSSIDGNYAIISAKKESYDENGENLQYQAGAAYIFEINNEGNWIETQKIVASDRDEGDSFGQSVAISGNYAIVSAVNEDEDELGENTMLLAGSAYIYERNTDGLWIEVQKIVASDRSAEDLFGFGVAIDGNTIIIGADHEDEDENGENYTYSAGSCYIFERNTNGLWSETQKIVASDRASSNLFGRNISIDGDYAVVSAHQNATDSNDENPLGTAGASYIFENNSDGIWIEVNKLIASDRTSLDKFGSDVGISGDICIVSAKNNGTDVEGSNEMNQSGSAYVFERNEDGNWFEIQKLVASDRQMNADFGFSMDLHNNRAIFGATGDTEDENGENPLSDPGAAYIFKMNSAGIWSEEQKIVASDRANNDNFGVSVGVSQYHAIVSTYLEDDDELGENWLTYAGSAYIFENTLALTVEDNDVNSLPISIYPNPTNSYGHIDLGEVYSEVQLSVYNLGGQNISRYSYQNIDQIELSIEGPKGIYFIKIILDSKETKMLKILKN